MTKQTTNAPSLQLGEVPSSLEQDGMFEIWANIRGPRCLGCDKGLGLPPMGGG